MTSMHRMFRPIYVAIALAVALFAGLGASAWAATGTADSIPRCVNDDYNDGSQDRCWSEGPQGVFVLDSSDHVVSVDDADHTIPDCEVYADGGEPVGTRTDVCVTDDGDLSLPQ